MYVPAPEEANDRAGGTLPNKVVEHAQLLPDGHLRISIGGIVGRGGGGEHGGWGGIGKKAKSGQKNRQTPKLQG